MKEAEPTQEQAVMLVRYISEGASYSAACELSKIGFDTFLNWLEQGRSTGPGSHALRLFVQEIEQARQKALDRGLIHPEGFSRKESRPKWEHRLDAKDYVSHWSETD